MVRFCQQALWASMCMSCLAWRDVKGGVERGLEAEGTWRSQSDPLLCRAVWEQTAGLVGTHYPSESVMSAMGGSSSSLAAVAPESHIFRAALSRHHRHVPESRDLTLPWKQDATSSLSGGF